MFSGNQNIYDKLSNVKYIYVLVIYFGRSNNRETMTLNFIGTHCSELYNFNYNFIKMVKLIFRSFEDSRKSSIHKTPFFSICMKIKLKEKFVTINFEEILILTTEMILDKKTRINEENY